MEGCGERAQLQRLYVRTPDAKRGTNTPRLVLRPRIRLEPLSAKAAADIAADASAAPETAPANGHSSKGRRGGGKEGGKDGGRRGGGSSREGGGGRQLVGNAEGGGSDSSYLSSCAAVSLPPGQLVCLRLPLVYASPSGSALVTRAVANDSSLLADVGQDGSAMVVHQGTLLPQWLEVNADAPEWGDVLWEADGRFVRINVVEDEEVEEEVVVEEEESLPYV